MTDRLTEVNMTVTEAAGPAWSAGVTTASSSELTSTPRTTAVSSQTVVEVSQWEVGNISRASHFRLGPVGSVVQLLSELWRRSVEPEQVLQGTLLSSHNVLPDQDMQHSPLSTAAPASLCSPGTIPATRPPAPASGSRKSWRWTVLLWTVQSAE